MNGNVVGLDLAKSIFHLYSLSAEGKPVKKKLKRHELLAYIANMPVSLIGMEACGGAYHWAREFMKLGRNMLNFCFGNKVTPFFGLKVHIFPFHLSDFVWTLKE